jgi:hypothetical protein
MDGDDIGWDGKSKELAKVIRGEAVANVWY